MADKFSKLKKMFSTGTIVRHAGGKKLKVTDLDGIQSGQSNVTRDRFARVFGPTGGYSGRNSAGLSVAYQSQRMLLFRDYDVIDCVDGDTKIPLPDGSLPTIRELAERSSNEPVYVFAYDKSTNTIKLGEATHIRSKGVRPTIKIIFDNNKTLVVTPDHKIMMRDGTFREAKDIKVGESVMPFSCFNHKVISIESNCEREVFDMTVEGYQNFATDNCFVHNCDPIMHSVLDIYASECSTRNEYGDVLTIECENQDIKDILENLYYDILNIEFNLYMWVRNLCKYGDFFAFLELNDEYGVTNFIPLSVYDTVRVEGSDPDHPHYVYFETVGASGNKQKIEEHEAVHFRLTSDANFLPYGTSILEGSRRVFKQLILLEDAMLIHRIQRAPEKRMFKVPIGNLAPNEVAPYMKTLRDSVKKAQLIDPKTGDYNMFYNMQNLLEDFWLPIRSKDDGASIENLGGLEWSPIDDINFILSKLLASIKIPKSYLGYGGEDAGGGAGKLTLAAQDIRFARSIEQIQRLMENELKKIGMVHLYLQGYKDKDLIDFKIHLNPPSTIHEQEKINLLKEKSLVAKQLKDLQMLGTDTIYKMIFELSEKEIEEERNRVIEDAKEQFRIQQILSGADDPANALKKDQEDSYQVPDNLSTEVDKGGRPEKGSSYGQHSDPRGQDPLGAKERYHAIGDKKQRTPKKKSPLSLEYEMRRYSESFKNLKPRKDTSFLNEIMVSRKNYINELKSIEDLQDNPDEND